MLTLQVDYISYLDYPEEASEHLSGVNKAISNLKRFILSTHHGVHKKYRGTYVSEFVYRYNRRYWPQESFDRLLYACIQAVPTTLPELNA